MVWVLAWVPALVWGLALAWGLAVLQVSCMSKWA